MSLEFDDLDTVNRAKRNDYLSNLLELAINSNEDGETILRLAGLSSYIDQYKEWLLPYTYNGKWQNDNPKYMPKSVFNYFFNEINENDKERQFMFLKVIVEKISNFGRYDINIFNRHLSVLGFKIIESNDSNTKGFTLIQIELTIEEDGKDYSEFQNLCNKICDGSYKLYEEAISDYKEGNLKSCIAVSRNFLEMIVKKLSGESDTSKAIFKLSDEAFVDQNMNIVVKNTNQAINYWCKYKRKVYKFMRLYTLYNVICAFGSHDDVNPTTNDTLWILHELQSTIYWILNR